MSQTPTPATFTFAGTVRRTRASHLPEVPAADDTCVVEVDRVLAAPPALVDVTGEVTVQLPDGVRLEEGQRRTFATVGWVIGQGIAVRAVEVTDAPDDRPAAAAADRAAAELSSRVASADLIVRGVVSDVRNVGTPTRISEHEPDWHEAIVTVDTVRKGDPPPTDVVVTFPLSRDITWHDAPKLAIGQRGVFLLRAAARADLPAGHAAAMADRPYPTYTALDPMDVLEESQDDHVAALTEEGETP